MEDSFNPYSFVHVWFNPLWIRNIPVRNCANHMLLLMFNIHCGPNMCIAHSGFNDYGMIMYHLLVLVVPSLFEIITWNKPIALEALERCGHSYGHMLQPCFPHVAGLRESLQAGLWQRISDLHRKIWWRKACRATRQFHTIPDKKGGAGWFQGLSFPAHLDSVFSAARCSFRFPGMWEVFLGYS